MTFIFCKRILKHHQLIICAIWLCLATPVFAQRVITIQDKNFIPFNQYFLDSGWVFHPGELPGKKAPENITKDWASIKETFFGMPDSPNGWHGMGWFAIRLRADTGLVGKKLYFAINHDGASEIFLDGHPIGGYGKVGYAAADMQAIRAPRDMIPLWFSDTRPHLLSIRYSNYIGPYHDFLGFQVSAGYYAPREERMRNSKALLGYLPMFAAAQLVLGLLHFLLYLFYPRQKLNAYYALLVLLIGLNGLSVYHHNMTPYPAVQYFVDFLTSVFKILIMWAAVLLFYVLNYKRVPRWRLILLSVISLAYLTEYVLQFWVYYTNAQNDYFVYAYMICIGDALWSATQIIKRKEKGAWLIGIGFLSVVLIFIFTWGDIFTLWTSQLNYVRLFVMGAGSLVLPICLSLYLALEFAGTNQNLAGKLREVEKLSAEALARESEKRELIASEAKRLELIVNERTAELKEQAIKLQELDVAKTRFFSNITHEFRTPLTLIINPAKQALQVPEADARKNLKLIVDNAERLLLLVNQLLDFSKIESKHMRVATAPVELIALIKQHLQAFEPLATQKNISLSLNATPSSLWIMSDRDKLDKIFLNTLSNALKFTDEGMICIDLNTSGNILNILISDTGKGIATDKLPHIFTRFYQADPSDTRSAEGTGIGLSLTKELVALMGGAIGAISVEGQFTRIWIDLPYEPASITNDIAVQPVYHISQGEQLPAQSLTKTSDDKPLILLIEDHADLRAFIAQTLSANYRLITAADGEEGINAALQEIPNLVITDLMMPKVSGQEVCATLKIDERTSHIPIIILTAKSGTDNRIRGIENGADAYLAKPFDQRELIAIIENLISIREQLRLRYSRQDRWFAETTVLPSVEQAFLSKIKTAVETHLNEEGYSADQLASDIGLSRTQLHRKLKDLIGQAPGEFIRTVRLEHAHGLLQRRVGTISEIAYKVGFSNPANFSASFSRHFGYPPKQAIKH